MVSRFPLWQAMPTSSPPRPTTTTAPTGRTGFSGAWYASWPRYARYASQAGACCGHGSPAHRAVREGGEGLLLACEPPLAGPQRSGCSRGERAVRQKREGVPRPAGRGECPTCSCRVVLWMQHPVCLPHTKRSALPPPVEERKTHPPCLQVGLLGNLGHDRERRGGGAAAVQVSALRVLGHASLYVLEGGQGVRPQCK